MTDSNKIRDRYSATADSLATNFQSQNWCFALCSFHDQIPVYSNLLFRRSKRHYQALPYGEVAGAIQAARQSDARVAVKLAFEFLVLTVCRSGEVRRARWEEMELEAGEWTLPAEQMKQQREHRVPLSARAWEILVEARENTVGSEWVFPSPTGRTLKDFALSGLLRELGIPAVPHGFRSSFRDWAAERTDAPHREAKDSGH